MTREPDGYEGDKAAYKHENALLRAEVARLKASAHEVVVAWDAWDAEGDKVFERLADAIYALEAALEPKP